MADSVAGIATKSATPSTPGIDAWRLGTITTVGVGAFAVGHGWLNNLWWKGTPTDFHVFTGGAALHAGAAKRYLSGLVLSIRAVSQRDVQRHHRRL